MEQITKGNIEGLVALTIIRKGKELDRFEAPNQTQFRVAAANCIRGTATSNLPNRIEMSGGGNLYSFSPLTVGVTNNVTSHVGSNTSIDTGSTTTFVFKLQYYSGSSTVEWGSATVAINTRVYTGDTLQVTWYHTVSGLTTPGNNLVASYLTTGSISTSGGNADAIGIAGGVNAATGALTYNTPAAHSGNSGTGDNVIISGSLPATASGAPFPSSYNDYGWIGTGSTAWAQFSISSTDKTAAADKRANLAFTLDF